jgi:benzoylformate decarboxylase
MTTGAEALLGYLHAAGVEYVFGNPGSTETPLIAAYAAAPHAPRYVLGLHETVVTGMAEGYAAVTGRPAFVNLHTASGLGNAIGSIESARRNRCPVVVTAGQQDSRHLATDPFLSGDLTAIAGGVVKWGAEVRAARDLPVLLREAFGRATAGTPGPTFLSLPTDLLSAEAEGDWTVLPPERRATVSAEAPVLADALRAAGPGRCVIVASDEVAEDGAAPTLVALAELTGAAVYGASLHGRGVFPPAHPLWMGTLPSSAPQIRDTLAGFEVVLLLGSRPLMLYPYVDGSPVPDGVRLIHLAPQAESYSAAWPATSRLQGSLDATLAAVLSSLSDLDADAARPYLEERRRRRAEELANRQRTARERYATDPIHPMAAVHCLLGALPPDCVVVDESVSAGAYVRGFHRPSVAGRYFFSRAGGLGWGMPAAVGVSLGSGREPVLCVVGDGSTCYAPQAMWTAARERLPVIFAVIDNRGYGVLRAGARRQAGGGLTDEIERAAGLSLEPPVDFAGLAHSFGLPAFVATTAAEIGDAVRKALAEAGPTLLHVPVAS